MQGAGGGSYLANREEEGDVVGWGADVGSVVGVLHPLLTLNSPAQRFTQSASQIFYSLDTYTHSCIMVTW